MVARGERPWDCDQGKLVASTSGWINGIPHGIIAFGKAKTDNFLVINTDGWLVGYDKHSMKGTVFLILPTLGSTIGDWLEFPPHPDLRVDFATIFDGPEPTALPKAKRAHAKGSQAVDGDPSPGPKHVRLNKSTVAHVDDLRMGFRENGRKRRKDKYYETTATVSVRRGRETEIIQLTRDHSGADLSWLSVFGREIGLELGRRYWPPYDEVTVWVLPEPRTQPQESPGAPPVRQVLSQLHPAHPGPLGRASAVGDIALTLESVDHDAWELGVEANTSTVTAATATIIAERDGSSERIELSTTFSGPLVYERIFDHEIALDIAVQVSYPTQALAMVWIRRAGLREGPAGNAGLEATCEPTQEVPAVLSRALQPGRYRLTLVATEGSKAGASVLGEMTLREPAPEDRSPRTGEPARDRGRTPTLWGWTDADVDAAGVPLCDGGTSPDSDDPVYPGVVVDKFNSQSIRQPEEAPVLLLATVSNLRNGTRKLDGCGASLFVQGERDGVFWGSWMEGGIRLDGRGRFCLEPLAAAHNAPAAN